MIRRRYGHGRDCVAPVRQPSLEDSKNRDDGFTLVELVIVLTVIPIVIAAIAAAVITSFKDQADVYNRLSDSHDAQITSGYFVPDVESASFVSTSASVVPCESIAAPVLLELTEFDGGQAEQIYYIDNAINYHPDSQQNAMLRIVCAGNGFTVQVGTNTIVAHSVTSANASISCVTPAPPPPPPQASWSPWTACTATGGSGPAVSSVSLTVSEIPLNTANVQLDSFNYSLSASPRAWVPDTAAATGGAPLPALLVLGPNMKSGTNLIEFTPSASGQTLTTTGPSPAGDIDVDSKSAGSISMFGNDAIKSSGNPPGAFDIYNCASSAGVTCTNGAVSSIGSNNTTPNPISMASPELDPLGNLPTPTVPSLSPAACTSEMNSNISVSNQSGVICTPGIYTSGLTISGNSDVITFQSGTPADFYQFGNSGCKTKSQCAKTGLNITGTNDTINFQSATYVFEGSTSDANTCGSSGLSLPNRGGMSISGLGRDTLQDGGAGVLLDFEGGAADFGCGVTADNTISLSPMTTGPYQGVLLFDNRTPTVPQLVVLDGFSTNGTIYASSSFVEAVGTAMNTAGSLVAQTLQLAGNLTLQ